MKAWRVHGYGDMRLDEVPEPEPPPGWVKARIRVVQPSITESLLFQGRPTYLAGKIAAALAKGPAQLFGHEFSAEIVALGAGVTGLAPWISTRTPSPLPLSHSGEGDRRAWQIHLAISGAMRESDRSCGGEGARTTKPINRKGYQAWASTRACPR